MHRFCTSNRLTLLFLAAFSFICFLQATDLDSEEEKMIKLLADTSRVVTAAELDTVIGALTQKTGKSYNDIIRTLELRSHSEQDAIALLIQSRLQLINENIRTRRLLEALIVAGVAVLLIPTRLTFIITALLVYALDFRCYVNNSRERSEQVQKVKRWCFSGKQVFDKFVSDVMNAMN